MTYSVRVTCGNREFDVYLTYRWWVPTDDPWSADSSGSMPARNGDWNFRALAKDGVIHVNGKPNGQSKNRELLWMGDVPTSGSSLNMRVGSGGLGSWYSGYGQQNTSVYWECVGVS